MYSHARIKTFLSQKGPEIKPQARHPLGKGIAKPRIEYEECMKTGFEEAEFKILLTFNSRRLKKDRFGKIELLTNA